MRAGHPPFGEAKEDDRYYELLMSNRQDLFWRAHSRNKEPGYFSPEFMDLVTLMLAHQPHQRLGMADIIAHPWLSGDGMASESQILKSFSAGSRF